MILRGVTPELGRRIGEPLDRLWERLPDPSRPHAAISVLFGVPPGQVADLGTLLLAGSYEAQEVLRTTPVLLRNLAQGTSVSLERCVHEVRGQVAWSETIQAWGNTYGDTDVFICANPRRDRDVAENRVLVWALHSLSRACRAGRGEAGRRFHPRLLQELVEVGSRASALLAHPLLAEVQRRRPTSVERRKVRQSKHVIAYRPALELVQQAQSPFRREDLAATSDWRTAVQHELLAVALDHLGPGAEGPMAAAGDFLVLGPLRYRHWSHPEGGGLEVGDVLIDVVPAVESRPRAQELAELQARAGHRRAVLVECVEDLSQALEDAVGRRAAAA